MKPQVLIVGGGFAGLSCALTLPADGFQVTVVDQRRHFEFIPNVHELLSGQRRPGDLRLPLAALLRAQGHHFVRDTVVDADATERSVSLESGRTLAADYLVLATGSADATYGVTGVTKHAFTMKSVDDGRAIAARLALLRREKTRPRVVIVGAGLAGVEALGELLRHHGQRYELHLVEAQDRLLPGAPDAAAEYLARLCLEQGVSLHLGDAVSRLTAKTVWLKSGARLPSDMTIWTGGPAPPPLLHVSNIARPGAWPEVGRDLSLAQAPGVFVAGDSAELQKPITRQAYYALDMGRAVAGNLLRLQAGRLKTKTFRPLPRPTLLAFGDISCILIAGRSAFSGAALMAAKEGIYAVVMAQLDRRRPGRRLNALFERGKHSGESLWPILRSGRLLTSAGRLQRLRPDGATA